MGDITYRMAQRTSEIQDSYPLSPMQQGMIFHNLYAPASGVDIVQTIFGLHEELSVQAFHRAWRQVVARHAALRTSFSLDAQGEPFQTVHRNVNLGLEQQDWRRFTREDREERLNRYLKTDRKRGFALLEAPLMRLALFKLAEADYQFVWSFHHALLDGRSFSLVLKEVFAYYEAFCRGLELQLEQPRPYRDYIDWLQRLDLSKAESFWRHALKGFTAPTPLLISEAIDSPSGDEDRHAKQERRLSSALTSALGTLAQQNQLTLNTMVQGAWAILLSRYSGEDDVVFGATRACRYLTVAGSESIVGVFINTLPVRAQVAPDISLLAWLKELRAQHIGLREYEHTPLVKIQGWSEVARGMPLFESILVFENYQHNAALHAQGGGWENREFRILGQTNYPLTLRGYAEAELLLEIAYDRRRFDDAAVARILDHLDIVLQGMAANLEQRVSDLPILTPAERRQLLVEWNNTKRDYPKDKCIHELFEDQVERTPDAVALMFEDRKLTYRELNQRANRLAHRLRSLGVGPEAVVGICMNRSLEMVTGLLAVLKAGGAYLPLDPTWPRERLGFMLEDAHAPILLTQQQVLQQLPEATSLGDDYIIHNRKSKIQNRLVICLDTDEEIAAQERDDNPPAQARSENLVYLIYTSGSTGNPKGVLIEHRQILNYVQAIRESCRLEPGASFAMVQPLSFDASQTVLFPSLISGACLHIVSEEKASDPQALTEYFCRFPIDLLKITPSHLAALQVSSEPGQILPRRWLIIGGEASRRDWLEKVQATGDCSIFNHYGPTEATVGVLTYELKAGQRDHSSLTVPIGHPLPNTQAYLLDRYLHPVPIGVPGELHIGGSCLGRGYLNSPDLTAEKFIPDPFSDEPGTRLYRTGDLARYLRDGSIEFLGRRDHQVKVRGFRIELGEIETVLSQHPSVRETLALVRKDSPEDTRLIVYVVPNHHSNPTSSELRSFLKAKLPNYMIPSAFVFLDALPLTASGKLDRRYLPAPDQTRLEGVSSFALPAADSCRLEMNEKFVAPRNPIEQKVAVIWAELLGLEQVGIHDNFFDLGGHSLLATQVIARVRRAFRMEIPLRALFEKPTVEELALTITEEMQGKEEVAGILVEVESLSEEETARHLLEQNR